MALTLAFVRKRSRAGAVKGIESGEGREGGRLTLGGVQQASSSLRHVRRLSGDDGRDELDKGERVCATESEGITGECGAMDEIDMVSLTITSYK